jgi:lipopolysaccharide transport system ATP-binding protein
MNKAEIERHFDEIVEFSEVERFIDTPVKHYSSGMYLRLAFGVAAHLNPEILLVDEVLAVGDANFQKKCLGKMGDVARDGRTILFVSHNMSAIQELCQRGILIESGKVAFDGRAMDCVAEYYRHSNSSLVAEDSYQAGRPLEVSGLKVNGRFDRVVESGQGFEISLDIKGRDLRNPKMFFIIENVMGQAVIHEQVLSKDIGLERIDGAHRLNLSIPALWLSPGVYSIYFKFLCSTIEWEGKIHSERLMLEVHGEMENTGRAVLNPKITWGHAPQTAGNGIGAGERPTLMTIHHAK